METETIIELSHVKKEYHMGNETINAVDDVSFTINKGEFCCLLGTSGSGKSTLLNLMAGIETVTSGKIVIKGKNIPDMSENGLAKFRQRFLGFVFQAYNLIPTMTALENVEFPLVFKRVPPRKRRRMAREMLKKVGLGNRLGHKPTEMSGGQQQRVGIARAFVGKPEIVFADEPTGNLDTKTTKEVMDLIKQMAKENKQTIIMVTHDRSLAAYADKIIHISDGQIRKIELPGQEPILVPEDMMIEVESESGAIQDVQEKVTEESVMLAETIEDKREIKQPEQNPERKTVLVKKIVVKRISLKELYQGSRKGRKG